MANGEWVASSEWRMANGEWRMERRGAPLSTYYSLLATRHSPSIRHSPLCLRHFLPRLFGALAVVGVEEFFAQANRFGRDLDQLIVLDIGQRLFQRHPDRRRQAHRLVLGGGADIGELLALEDVDLEVVVAGVLADDHALVDLPARLDHHRAAVFQLEH